MPLFRRSLPLLLLPGSSLAVTRARVGEVAALTGEARALFSGAPPRDLEPRAPLLIEDLVTTGPGARLVAELDGGIEIRLGERASLRVDAHTLRGPGAGTAIRIFDGPALLDRPARPGAGRGGGPPITMTLPWARIGVRGTRFFAGPLDGRHAVFVARGRVVVEARGTMAEVSEGEGVDVPEPGAPLGPVTRWGRPRIERALALVA